MDYTIVRGDTLSALARRFHTSVDALAKANHLADPNLIITGHHLKVPGGSDGFGPRPSSGPSRDDGFVPTKGGSNAAFAIARSELGKNAGDLKREDDTAVGKAMENWVGNTVNCASFVSACLEAAGQISHSGYSASSMGLKGKLDANRHFQNVDLQHAQPGDVVTFDTGGGHHTVMFAGWKNGKPQFIGSNNVNADGTQKITQGGMGYKILSIHHFVG